MKISFSMALVMSFTGATYSFAGEGAVEAPKTVEEGMSRLEKLLGRYTEQDNRQWRFTYDDEVPLTPEPGKALVVVRKGTETYGVPVRSGDLITFDTIESLQRAIYDVSAGGERTLSREIQNHTTRRYTLRRSLAGDWFFDSESLSHSIPEYRDRPCHNGRVNWLTDGIELVGFGTDNFFRQGGKLVPGAYLMKRKLTCEGNRLVETIHSQNYELAKGPEGDVLPMPDFSSPFGEPFTGKLESEPIRRVGSSAIAAVDDPKDTSTEIDGTWKLTKYIVNGRSNDEVVRMDYKVVRAHGVQEITTGGKPFTKRKFTVDPKKKPKHIDFIDDQNTRNLGIYELKADQLTVAQFAEKEKMTSDRPTKFDNGGMIIAVYERVKE